MNKKLTITLAIHFSLMFALAISGCPGPEPAPDGPSGNGGQVTDTEFIWDTAIKTPRWRLESPVEWRGTGDMQSVFQEHADSGKPVLIYVSSIDNDLTATIEGDIFSADAWGPAINEKFIPWEVDRWVNPALAYDIAATTPLPAIFVAKLGTDPENDAHGDLVIVDSWFGSSLLSFPFHEGVLPVDDPEAIALIDSYGTSDEIYQSKPIMISSVFNKDSYVDDIVAEIQHKLDEGEAIYPEESLLLAFKHKAYGVEAEGLESHVNSWDEYMAEYFPNLGFMPEDAYGTGGGWTITPSRTLYAVMTSSILGMSPNLDSELSGWVEGSLSLEDGKSGGGFSPFYDIRNTYTAGSEYIDDNSDPGSVESIDLGSTMTGHRNLIWSNASILANLLKLANTDEEFGSMQVGGSMMREFLLKNASLIIKSAESQSDITLSDKIYLLDLYNQYYQATADIDVLNSSGDIAAGFKSENIDSWFNSDYFPLYSDFALSLHHYGWLAHDTDALDSAKAITDKCLDVSSMYSYINQVKLAYAYDVVHSMSIHVSILGPPSDPISRELLQTSLKGYDPRKLAQILDPERDGELIKEKGYYPQPDIVAFVCLDESCYMPSKTSEEVLNTLEIANTDLLSERNR
jgi:hypothetical protein